MLERVPLAFALDLDPGAVDQDVQRALRGAVASEPCNPPIPCAPSFVNRSSGTKSLAKWLALRSSCESFHMAVRTLPSAGRRGWASVPGQETLRYFAAAFFALTLLTDWAYTQTTVLTWKDFSSWLLFAGLVAAGIAVLLWLVGLVVYRERPLWGVVFLNALVLVAAFFNSLVHAGDGWTAIVPWGIGLSVLTCLLMLVSATLRRTAFRPMQRV